MPTDLKSMALLSKWREELTLMGVLLTKSNQVMVSAVMLLLPPVEF